MMRRSLDLNNSFNPYNRDEITELPRSEPILLI